jgi:2-iminoacetate synthase ThiH
LSTCREILTSQNMNNASRLTIEDAIILYDQADLNDLMGVALNRRRLIIPIYVLLTVNFVRFIDPQGIAKHILKL